jgi:insulin receptor substrate 2
MTGTHRLCLTANTLFIVKFDPQTDSQNGYEFPLISIRRCGHTSNTFFIELGRSSSIGPGELWIQADDSVMAQNMHEVILTAMKSSKNHEEFGPSQRPRSASTSDKPISSRRPQTSSTNQNNPIFGTPVQSFSSSTSTSVPTQSTTIDSIRDRCDSMPSKSRTSENESSHDSRLWTSAHYHTSDRLHSGLYNRTVSYSPPSNNPLRLESIIIFF